jgi:hypothetical protein
VQKWELWQSPRGRAPFAHPGVHKSENPTVEEAGFELRLAGEGLVIFLRREDMSHIKKAVFSQS